MKIQININGKNINAEISEEDAKVLGMVDKRPRTGYERGYERVDEYESYFIDDTINDGYEVIGDEGTLVNNLYYNNGNYYNDKSIVENNARADRLLRQLRQWQALNDKPISQSDWEDNGKNKWCILYSYGAEKLYVDYFHYIRLHNAIYFTTKEKAEEAIEVFKDELIWYFTEYVQRLDEV